MALVLNGSSDTITGLQINSANIVDGSITSADLASGAGGKFASYAVICDEKSNNGASGTFSSGAWRTRDLNTTLADADNIVSISSNQFTLSAAGSYLIECYAPAFRVGSNMARLYDITGSAVVRHGMATMSDTGGDGDTSIAFVFARHTITSSNTYEVQHRCSTSESTEGFGRATDFGNVEKYTMVKIFKES